MNLMNNTTLKFCYAYEIYHSRMINNKLRTSTIKIVPRKERIQKEVHCSTYYVVHAVDWWAAVKLYKNICFL